MSYRDPVPVEPVELPQRFSQTLLSRANVCPYSAYLYQRYEGGGPSHEMDFGSAFHAFAEKAMLELIQNDEESLYAPAEGEDPVAARGQVASLTAAMVDDVLREHPEWHVPVGHRSHSVDHLRQLAYHYAIAYDVAPSTVLGLERKFVLDLDCGWTVSGKIDVLALEGGTLRVDDFKSSFMPSLEDDFEGTFQLKFYALLALLGQPVEESDGVERRLPRLGDGINVVESREIYPRHLRQDGSALWSRDVTLTRTAVADFKNDVELLASKLADAFSESRFGAVDGSHCSQCTCPSECPLPAQLRDGAGSIETVDDAALAAEWLDRVEADAKAVKKEIRRVASREGPIRYGADRVWEFREQESRSVDVDGMTVAALEAARFGTPFDPDAFITFKTSNRFTARRLKPEELGDEEPEQTPDEKWGEVPF